MWKRTEGNQDDRKKAINSERLESTVLLEIEQYDRRKLIEERTIITRPQSRFVRRYVVVFRLWICYQLGNSVDFTRVGRQENFSVNCAL